MSTLRPSKLVDSVGYSPVSFQRNLHLRKAVLRGTKVPFTSERVLQFSLGIQKNETWATLLSRRLAVISESIDPSEELSRRVVLAFWRLA